MTNRVRSNLINILEKKGMSAEEILGIIKYVETANPKHPDNNA